jgi:hypothetical protein
MKILSILFGLSLTGLGIWNFTATGSENLWTLGPVIIGLLAVSFAFLQGRWEHKHPLFGVVMMAILSVLGSIPGLWNLGVLLIGGTPTLADEVIFVQSFRGGLSVLFIILVILLVDDVWHHWREFGQLLGDWLGRVVLTLFYFTVFVPFGIGVRLLGDPLQIKQQPEQLWRPRPTGDQSLEDVLRQF